MTDQEVQTLREVAADAAKWLSTVSMDYSAAENIPDDLVNRLVSAACLSLVEDGYNLYSDNTEYKWVLMEEGEIPNPG
jgi:hypothetical protein